MKVTLNTNNINLNGGVMIRVLTASAVDRRFEPWSLQTKDCKIDICCFSAKHTTLRGKNKSKTGWLWIRKMSQSGVTCLPMDCCASLLQNGHYHHFIECNLFLPWYTCSWKIAHLALNNNHLYSYQNENFYFLEFLYREWMCSSSLGRWT
jgi:hypothetical protein